MSSTTLIYYIYIKIIAIYKANIYFVKIFQTMFYVQDLDHRRSHVVILEFKYKAVYCNGFCRNKLL